MMIIMGWVEVGDGQRSIGLLLCSWIHVDDDLLGLGMGLVDVA
jgi:hypothetical protein